MSDSLIKTHGPTPLVEVRGLTRYFDVGRGRRVHAVDNVSLSVAEREIVGLVGESGSGKSTFGKTLLGLHYKTAGEVLFRVASRSGEPTPGPSEEGNLGDGNPPLAPPRRGTNDDFLQGGAANSRGPLLGGAGVGFVDLAQLSEAELKPLRTQMQMIFQDPFSSLNPRMTVGDIVAEPLLIHGIGTKEERLEKVMEMLRKVGLKPEHRTRYPHAFSGGQRQRIGIARALIMNPRLVVCDEAVSALDVSVQAQVINLLADLQKELGLTYIFIAHDLSVVKHICDRIAVMYAGKIVELAPAKALFESPKHPYTKALLSAVPNPDPDVPMNMNLSGEVADPGNLPPGCAFHPRCSQCFGPCDRTSTALAEVEPGRFVSCHLYDDSVGINKRKTE